MSYLATSLEASGAIFLKLWQLFFFTNGINLSQLPSLIDLFTTLQASGTNSFGVVVGGSSLEQRKLCATEVSKRNVSGYFNISFILVIFSSFIS